jgi:hypothetical protein
MLRGSPEPWNTFQKPSSVLEHNKKTPHGRPPSINERPYVPENIAGDFF